MKNNRFPLKQANILIVYEKYNNINELVKIIGQERYNTINNVLYSEFSVAVMKENIPDLILIYQNISDFNVYETCKTIKANSDFEGTPIIIISEYNNIDKKKIFEIGIDDYITIPFNNEEIKKRIDMHLKFRFMELELEKTQNISIYDKLIDLKCENKKLKNDVIEKKQKLEDIALELQEFNDLLREEINERIKTQEALEKSEKQFRYSIEEAPVPIMLYDEEGKIKTINRHWTNITGYSIEDMPMIFEWAQVSDVFSKKLFDMDTNDDINSEARNNKCEFLVKTCYGDIRIWDFHMGCIGDPHDGHKLFVILAIDITERKKMEELQKNIEEKRKKIYELKEYDKIRTEFFANISHELRTPINVIFSALQMFEFSLKEYQLKNKNIDKDKYIKIMKQNCYRILRLINNIIDITKIDSGYFDISEQNIDIVSLIKNISLSVSEYIESKGLSLIVNTNIKKKIIACDPEKIERIILNLLSNSIKFTSFGGKLTINIEDGTEYICIRVKDTGKGIPKEKLKSIFERFVQVNKSLIREHEGSGIGLSIVKSLVELHDGKIFAQSDLEQGAEFIIHIPCKLVKETSKKNLIFNSISNSNIEKINIEFSDIGN